MSFFNHFIFFVLRCFFCINKKNTVYIVSFVFFYVVWWLMRIVFNKCNENTKSCLWKVKQILFGVKGKGTILWGVKMTLGGVKTTLCGVIMMTLQRVKMTLCRVKTTLSEWLFERVKSTPQRVNKLEGSKRHFWRGRFGVKKNDSFQGVKTTLLFLQCDNKESRLRNVRVPCHFRGAHQKIFAKK